MLSIRAQAIFIFICGFLLFTIEQSTEIIGFESRFYVFALEMWRHGLTFFPTTYRVPYPDYPVTSTFLIYLSSMLLGGLTRFSAIFPTALASAVTLSVTYLIGALYSRVWGLAGAFFLLLTFAFVTEARSISLDQFTTAVTAICFYLVSSAKVLQKPKRVGWVLVLFVIGFAFRGPLGLVIPTGVVCVFFLLDKDFKKCLLIGLCAALLLVLCSAALLWLAHAQGGEVLFQGVIQKEVLGRLQEGAKNPPYDFYFKESIGAYAITYPLAILVLLGTMFNFKYSPSTEFMKKLLGWAVIVFIGLSIPADKKIRYILPAAPALALMCGYLFIVARERRYLYLLKKIVVLLCYLFPLIGLAGVYWLHRAHPELQFYYADALWGLGILLIGMMLVHRRELFAFGVAILSFFVILIFVIEPINVSLNQSSFLVAQIETLRHDKQAELVFYHQGHDGLVIKYIANMPEEALPLFIKTEPELKTVKKNMMLITTEEYYQALSKKAVKPFHIVLQGKLGREPIVVFMKR